MIKPSWSYAIPTRTSNFLHKVLENANKYGQGEENETTFELAAVNYAECHLRITNTIRRKEQAEQGWETL